jgi:hypothetical protein
VPRAKAALAAFAARNPRGVIKVIIIRLPCDMIEIWILHPFFIVTQLF